jgi:SAM-dependent methyltransferase
MGVIGGTLAGHVLMRLSPDGEGGLAQGVPPAYRNRSKMEVLLGPGIWEELRGKTVVDFGCGPGLEAVEMVEHGARHVIGIDIDELDRWLERAVIHARERGVADRCTFAKKWDGHTRADVILSMDAFEHFEDPAGVLATFHDILKPDGSAIVSFGPTWYHPYGGHLYSIFPYAHCVFTEKALVGWRSKLPGKEAAHSFMETGINQMTIRRFEKLIAASPFEFASFEAVPIRRLRWIANKAVREFTTSTVRCRLVPRKLN